jgi:hypothetical protein
LFLNDHGWEYEACEENNVEEWTGSLDRRVVYDQEAGVFKSARKVLAIFFVKHFCNLLQDRHTEASLKGVRASCRQISS